MKKNKKLLSLAMASTVALTTCFVNAPALTTKADTMDNVSPKTVPPTVSTQYAQAMYPGWNLGNTFECTDGSGHTDETMWGNPYVTKDLIDEIAHEGFKSIRMPFTSFDHEVAAPYTIDPARLARYEQAVQWAIDDGLYVLVDATHGDSWSYALYYEASDDGGKAKAQYEAVWTQLADAFKDFDSKVCFESQNEIDLRDHSGDVSSDVKNQRVLDLNQDFYNIVRNSGGKNATRMLDLPPVWHNASTTTCDPIAKQIKDLNDPNLMTSFHFYYAWWDSVSNYDTNMVDEISNIKTAYDTAYDEFVKNGIGVTIGEIGMQDNGYKVIEPGNILKLLEYGFYYARVNGLAPMLWDRGTDYLDRKSSPFTWKDPKKIDMIKAAWTGRASYAYSDRIFVKDKNSDVNVPLSLNGNTLSSIYNGTTKLVEGQDYTYASSTVTLKAAYVSNLMSDGYGTKATLTFNFSAGPAWDADLISYAAPAVSSFTGSASSNLVIPVQFNGSKLSYIDSLRVVDGQPVAAYPYVGGATWSMHKFSDEYTIDYSANTITMTNNYLKSVDSTLSQFMIKLYFQSGEEKDLTINQANGQLAYTAPVVVATPTATITSDNSKVIVERNQSATFTVSMNQLTNANAFDVTLKYNNSLYNVSKIEYLSGLTQISKSDNDGTLRLIFGKTDKTTITAADYTNLVKLTLVPKTVNASQDASVTLVNANTAAINNGVAVDAACTLGQATGLTTIKLASDINLSGDVTLADLSIALSHYMDDKNSANWTDAQLSDINNDGVVDIVDLQLIAGYIK